jgi:hypothetical protein
LIPSNNSSAYRFRYTSSATTSCSSSASILAASASNILFSLSFSTNIFSLCLTSVYLFWFSYIVVILICSSTSSASRTSSCWVTVCTNPYAGWVFFCPSSSSLLKVFVAAPGLLQLSYPSYKIEENWVSGTPDPSNRSRSSTDSTLVLCVASIIVSGSDIVTLLQRTTIFSGIRVIRILGLGW